MADPTKFQDMGNIEDYKWMDPMGNYAAMQEYLRNAQSRHLGNMDEQIAAGTGLTEYDPNQYMQDFMQNQALLSQVAQDASSPLGASLQAIAADQARYGGEAALAALGPGARNSGAGMSAFGESYARPFAEAAAQTQAAQLGLFGNLAGQSMGLSSGNQQFSAGLGESQKTRQMQAANLQGGLYGSAMNLGAGMAADQGAWYQPTYVDPQGNAIAQDSLNQAKKAQNWNQFMDVTKLATGIGSLGK